MSGIESYFRPPLKRARASSRDETGGGDAGIEMGELNAPSTSERSAKPQAKKLPQFKICPQRRAHSAGASLPIANFGTFKSGEHKKTCLACLTLKKGFPSTAKGTAKVAAERAVASDAAYVTHTVAQGGAIEPRLTQPQVLELSLKIKKKSEEIIVFDAGAERVYFNIFTCRSPRMKESSTKRRRDGSFACTIGENEGWAGVTLNRGKGAKPSQLLSFADGRAATASQIRDLGWRIVKLPYETMRPDNMNDVEKKVHQLLRSEPGSLWKACGAGGVKLGGHKTPIFAIGIVYGTLTNSNGTVVLRKGGPNGDAV